MSTSAIAADTYFDRDESAVDVQVRRAEQRPCRMPVVSCSHILHIGTRAKPSSRKVLTFEKKLRDSPAAARQFLPDARRNCRAALEDKVYSIISLRKGCGPQLNV